MRFLLLAIDALAVAAALAAAWLWLRASGARVRRVSAREQLDTADLNRLAVALNRTQLLNQRAALAAMASALLVALHVATSLLSQLASGGG